MISAWNLNFLKTFTCNIFKVVNQNDNAYNTAFDLQNTASFISHSNAINQWQSPAIYLLESSSVYYFTALCCS